MEDQRNADRSVATAVKFNEYDVLDVLGVWQQYEKLFSKEEDIRILKEKKRASFLTLRIRQVTPWSKCPNFTEKDELLNLITEKKEVRRGLGEVDWPPYRPMSIVLFCVEFIVLAFHVIVHWGVGCTGDKSIVNFWRTFYHGWYQATFLVILAFALPVFFLTLKVWNMKEDIYIFDD